MKTYINILLIKLIAKLYLDPPLVNPSLVIPSLVNPSLELHKLVLPSLVLHKLVLHKLVLPSLVLHKQVFDKLHFHNLINYCYLLAEHKVLSYKLLNQLCMDTF